MREQISAQVVEVKEMYKRQVCWSNSFTLSATSSLLLLPLRVKAVMKSIIVFLIFTAIYPGLAKRSKPVLPDRPPATSLDTSDTACPSDSLVDEDIRKMKAMLGTESWFRPCDCGGQGWEKIAFYDFSQQECPPDFSRLYRPLNIVSCHATNRVRTTCSGRSNYGYASLPLPVQGRSYSSVCGRIRGHGYGYAFLNAIACNYSLEQAYVEGVSLTHGQAGRRTHIWTFAAAESDSSPYKTQFNCGCSYTNNNWTHATPGDVGDDYFCDSNQQFKAGRYVGKDLHDDLWDGEGCGSSSSCCEWKDPPYFCKHLHSTTSEDMEIRLFSYYFVTVSLIEIFVK